MAANLQKMITTIVIATIQTKSIILNKLCDILLGIQIYCCGKHKPGVRGYRNHTCIIDFLQIRVASSVSLPLLISCSSHASDLV